MSETIETPLPTLAAERAAAIRDADWLRFGGPAYDAAIAPGVAAAYERLDARRLLAADGETLAGLREALTEVNAVVAQLADEGKRDNKLDVLLRDTRSTLAGQIATLTDRLGPDETIVQRVAEPSLAELKTWTPEAFLRAQTDRLQAVLGAQGIREVLSLYWPTQRAEIRRRLASTPIAPRPSAPAEDGERPASRAAVRAASNTAGRSRPWIVEDPA